MSFPANPTDFVTTLRDAIQAIVTAKTSLEANYPNDNGALLTRKTRMDSLRDVRDNSVKITAVAQAVISNNIIWPY